MPASQVEPWEQQPGESSKAYSAFILFRDLGLQRTIDEASRLYHNRNKEASEQTPPGSKNRPSGQIRDWREKFDWFERAAAWDAEQDRKTRNRLIHARLEMVDRHVKQSKALQYKAIERLATLKPEELTVADVLRYFVEASKLERLSLGESTENIQAVKPIEFVEFESGEEENREAGRIEDAGRADQLAIEDKTAG